MVTNTILFDCSEEEIADARHREELDRLREDGRKKFSQEIKERVDGLRGAMRSVKGELFAKGASFRHMLFRASWVAHSHRIQLESVQMD